MIRMVAFQCKACHRVWQDTTAAYARRGPSCPYCGEAHREPGWLSRALDLAAGRMGRRGAARVQPPIGAGDRGTRRPEPRQRP